LQKTFLGENQWFSPIPLSSLGNLGFPKPFLIGENIIIKMEGALGEHVFPQTHPISNLFFIKKKLIYILPYILCINYPTNSNNNYILLMNY
jgi:hypothetical protein